jgi:nucleotide-binding universal stress UspA family protein
MTAPSQVSKKRRILVCYDGSPESARALDRVAEIASAVPSEVTVVSVAEPIYSEPPYTGYTDPVEEETHRTLLKSATRALGARGVTAATLGPVGKTVPAILETASELHADLIVVGSRNRGVVRRLLSGSVSGRLVLEALLDVLVVH